MVNKNGWKCHELSFHNKHKSLALTVFINTLHTVSKHTHTHSLQERKKDPRISKSAGLACWHDDRPFPSNKCTECIVQRDWTAASSSYLLDICDLKTTVPLTHLLPYAAHCLRAAHDKLSELLFRINWLLCSACRQHSWQIHIWCDNWRWRCWVSSVTTRLTCSWQLPGRGCWLVNGFD